MVLRRDSERAWLLFRFYQAWIAAGDESHGLLYSAGCSAWMVESCKVEEIVWDPEIDADMGHDVRASFAVQYGRLWLADGFTQCSSIIEAGVNMVESTTGVLESFALTQNVKTGTVSQKQPDSSFIYRRYTRSERSSRDSLNQRRVSVGLRHSAGTPFSNVCTAVHTYFPFGNLIQSTACSSFSCFKVSQTTTSSLALLNRACPAFSSPLRRPAGTNSQNSN